MAEHPLQAGKVDARAAVKPPPPKQDEPDKHTSRLLKYIPAELVALYITLDALIQTSEQLPLSALWIVFVVCKVFTYINWFA